jgi:hypothetical protein
MKLVVAVIVIPLYLFASHASGNETCSDRALNCVKRWGSPGKACYEPFRLEACEKTGKYVAPNGNVWPAIRAENAATTER